MVEVRIYDKNKGLIIEHIETGHTRPNLTRMWAAQEKAAKMQHDRDMANICPKCFMIKPLCGQCDCE